MLDSPIWTNKAPNASNGQGHKNSDEQNEFGQRSNIRNGWQSCS